MSVTPTQVDIELIRTLVESWGPPGYEHHIRQTIRGLVQDLADEIHVDGAGNLICRMGSGGKRILVAAHMDEIGMFVSHVDEKGFARFFMSGYLMDFTLYGNRVRFENGLIGNIGKDDIMALASAPKMAELYIDFSDGSGDATAVKPGDPAALWRPLEQRGTRLVAKSHDDRIGCAVAIMAMRKLKAEGNIANTVYFTFTTQEEVGLRGARAAAQGLDVDYAIALDVTSAGDTPKTKVNQVTLGAGAAINIIDGGHIVPPAIKDLMFKRAAEHGIKHQPAFLTGGTTDAAAIQTAKSGIPSGVISIPCRYVHTTSETVDTVDVGACVDLLAALMANPFEAEA
jgi:tetrahedral aminopeptidase